MDDFLFKDEGYKIIGCFYTVYNSLGSGFLESVYQEALAKEFEINKIPFLKEKKIEVFYQDEKLNKYFKADFICFDEIIVEIKAEKFLNRTANYQVINYLKATKYKLAYLVNFGGDKLFFKRLINTTNKSALSS